MNAEAARLQRVLDAIAAEVDQVEAELHYLMLELADITHHVHDLVVCHGS